MKQSRPPSRRLLHLLSWIMAWLCFTGCPDEMRQRQLAKELKQRKQLQRLQQLQQSLRKCKRALSDAQKASSAPRTTPRRLPPPLRRDTFDDPRAAANAQRWSARHIPILPIPKTPSRGTPPTDDKRLKYVQNKFWNYLRIRRKRVKHGLSRRLCRERRRYLKKHPGDPQAVLTVALCRANHHFKGELYFQIDFSGAVVIHRKEWHRDDIRAFLSRYRALVDKARSLGFYRLIFVGEDDLKRRQRRFDFKHKWYGHQVSFPTL